MSRKKHVIPRNEYARQRREFFHNEERERRIEQEKKENEIKEANEQELHKKNELRVKENMQKARIEKLTKEEIKKQEEASQSHPTIDLDDDSLSASQSDMPNGSEQTDTHQEKDEQENQSKDEISDIKYKKEPKQKEEPKQEDQTYDAQDKKSDFEKNRQLGAMHDENVEQKSQNSQNILNKLLTKVEKHWPIIAIILAIILIFILVWSIFQNINPPNEGRKTIEEQQSQKGFQKPITNVMEAVEKSKRSVVGVSHEGSDVSSKKASSQREKEENSGVGSGVVYKVEDNKAYIVTNAHVVSDDKKPIITTSNKKKFEGKIIGSDKWSDIAVLTISLNKNDHFKPIKFEDSDNLILGETAIVIGSPLGAEFQNSISTGVVSGLNRKVPVDFDGDDEYDWEIKAIQTDAAVNPGNSGGPILDSQGNLIGIVSLKIDMPNVEGMAFAIPSNEASNFINKLEKDGEIKRPSLGLMAQNYSKLSDSEKSLINLPDKYKSGMAVRAISKDGSADKAGIKFNDIIVGINNTKVENNLEFRKALYNDHKLGDEVTFQIIRDGKEITKSFTLK